MTKQRKTWLTLWGVAFLTVLALWIDLPGTPAVRIGSFERDFSTRLGLDLQGGSHLVYRADTTGLADTDVLDALAGVRDVLERRVNAFGVAEPVVQTNRVA